MPTKRQLIRAIREQPKVVDATISVGGEKLTIPAAIGIVQKGDTAYMVSYLKPEDIVAIDKKGNVYSKRGQISPATWEAFVPPPKELTEAKSKLKGINVPKGFQWAIINGEPTLVPTERRARGARTSKSPNKEKFPVGTVVKQKNKAGRTIATGRVVGYTPEAYKVEVNGNTVEVKQFGRYWSTGK
jgi:hypothetical protein